jgi:Helix-turn-helix domain
MKQKGLVMNAKLAVKDGASSVTTKVLEEKWGNPLLSEGFTVMPNIIFQHQKALKLKPLDVLVLLHLVAYWWKADEPPRPAKGTIANALDVDPRTVQRAVEKMEKLGYIKRIARKASAGDNLPNSYDLRGLVKAATKHALDQKNKKASRLKEDKDMLSTPTAFNLIKGGKVK